MRARSRSKLEMYFDILKVLAQLDPMKITPIMLKTNINSSVLKAQLDLLVSQDLVDERVVGNQKALYSITQQGVAVLKYFRELKQVVPIIKETRRAVSSRSGFH